MEPSLRRMTVEGRGEIHKLQEMLETHYSAKDSQVNQPTQEQHTPAIRVSNFASTFVPPPSRGQQTGRGGRHGRDSGNNNNDILYA